MAIVLTEYNDQNYHITEYDNGTIVKVSLIPTQSLSDIKNEKIQSLQQSYYASFNTFQSSALGTLKTYPIDKEAQDNLRDYQNRLIADPNKDNFYFKTIEDGTLVLHTRVQFLQLMEDAEQFKVNQTIHYDSLVQQVNTAYNNNDQAGIEAVVW